MSGLEVVCDYKEIISSEWDRAAVHMNSEVMIACTRPMRY